MKTLLKEKEGKKRNAQSLSISAKSIQLHHHHHHHHHMSLQPKSGPGLPFWCFVTITFYGAGFLVQRPTPNLEDQASVFMTPGDRVAQL
jgi:hypothetical protein